MEYTTRIATHKPITEKDKMIQASALLVNVDLMMRGLLDIDRIMNPNNTNEMIGVRYRLHIPDNYNPGDFETSEDAFETLAKKIAVETTAIMDRKVTINKKGDLVMENGNGTNEQVVNNVGMNNNGGQVPAQSAPPEQPPVVYVPVPTQPEKNPGWWSRNWKKVTTAAAATVTLVTTGIAAYKRGKHVGAAQMPTPNYGPTEDYSLNPNE